MRPSPMVAAVAVALVVAVVEVVEPSVVAFDAAVVADESTDIRLTIGELRDKLNQLRSDHFNTRQEVTSVVIPALKTRYNDKNALLYQVTANFTDAMREQRQTLHANADALSEQMRTTSKGLEQQMDAMKPSMAHAIWQHKATSKGLNRNITQSVTKYMYELKQVYKNHSLKIDEQIENVTRELGDMAATNTQFGKTILDITRQTMMLQFLMEEKSRADGDSGVKSARSTASGPNNYYESSFAEDSAYNIYDMTRYDRELGVGEMNLVMNGVEFTTSHSSYLLKQKSRTSRSYTDTEDIAFPPVPPAVTGTAEDQIVEMREYFKAFAWQNKTHRDYTDYFKPVLCYLEATWWSDAKYSFQPTDHWRADRDTATYGAVSGVASVAGGKATLPRTVINVNTTSGKPEYAGWAYRTLCTPINEELPTKHFRLAEDLAYRLPRHLTRADMMVSPGARFRLYEHEKDQFTRYGTLDRVMYTIPGLDNTAGNLSQVSFGDTMEDMGSVNGSRLKPGAYHRFFKFSQPGAMGLNAVARGFSDSHMWVAMTSQAEVAGFRSHNCRKVLYLPGGGRREVDCHTHETRFSYALPLEVVYLTPLLSWNPYSVRLDLTVKQVTKKGKATGRPNRKQAYAGASGAEGYFYITPHEFYHTTTVAADQSRVPVGVLGLHSNGKRRMKQLTASGTRTIVDDIPGCPPVRLRWPILPIHGEGGGAWKELNALKRVVRSEVGDPRTHVTLSTSASGSTKYIEHSHIISLSLLQYQRMVDDKKRFDVLTQATRGHVHKLHIYYDVPKGAEGPGRFKYQKCDGQKGECRQHRHPRLLRLVTDPQLLTGDGDDAPDGAMQMRVHFLLPSTADPRHYVTSQDPYARLYADGVFWDDDDDVTAKNSMAKNSPGGRPDYDYDYNAGGHGARSNDNIADGMNLNAME